jgi:myo-inositol-1(or 4)-monophosphatase
VSVTENPFAGGGLNSTPSYSDLKDITALADHPLFDELLAAREAALAAGAFLRHSLSSRENLQVELKGTHDFVSEVDRQSERMLREALLNHESLKTRAHGFLGEEGSQSKLDNKSFWIVDPLDGTSNFLHGMPAFAISIGLVQRRHEVDPSSRFPAVSGTDPVLGLIYDVCQGRLFYALQGAGAYVEDAESSIWRSATAISGKQEIRPIRVGQQKDLAKAFLATGFPVRNRDMARLYLEIFDRLMPVSAGVRRAGSAALDLAYCAAGIFDGFIELRLAPWDLAAGICLIREAEGEVRGLGCDPLADCSLMAGNASVLNHMEQLLRDSWFTDLKSIL